MIIQEQRQDKVVQRIRHLRTRQQEQFGALSIPNETELIELKTEATKNEWFYW